MADEMTTGNRATALFDRVQATVSLATLASLAISAGIAIVLAPLVRTDEAKKSKPAKTTKAKHAHAKPEARRPEVKASSRKEKRGKGSRVKRGKYDGSVSSRDFVVSGHSTGSRNTEMEALSHQVSIDAGRVPDYSLDGE